MPLYYTQPYRPQTNVNGGVTDGTVNQGLDNFDPTLGVPPTALGTGGTASITGGNGPAGTNAALYSGGGISPPTPGLSDAMNSMGYWRNFLANNPGASVTNPATNPQTNQAPPPPPPPPTTSPMAPNFAGGSTDSSVFTSPDYIKNLNQNIYAQQSNQGQAPIFTQDQFNNAWQNNMTQGAGNNYAAFNQALGTQDVVGPTGGVGQYGAQSTTTDPAMLAKMRLQNQINSGQTNLAQATANAGNYVNPQGNPGVVNPMTQAGGGAPGQAPVQNQQSNLLQMLQQLFGGGRSDSGGWTSSQQGRNFGGVPGYNSWGNPYGGNPFAFMTGQAGGPFSSMYGGGMGGYGGGFGGGFGNPMQGNYGQLGGVAQLLNSVQALQGGFGGRAPGYQSQVNNPFSGLGGIFNPYGPGNAGFGININPWTGQQVNPGIV